MLIELLTAQRHIPGVVVEFDPRKNTPKGFSRIALDVPESHVDEVRSVLERKGYEPCALTYQHAEVGEGEYICGRFRGKVRVEWLEYEGSGNPGLSPGSAANNQPRGERSGRAVMTESDVINARKRNSEGEGCRKIASDMGVGVTTVRNAIRGRTWAWLEGEDAA